MQRMRGEKILDWLRNEGQINFHLDDDRKHCKTTFRYAAYHSPGLTRKDMIELANELQMLAAQMEE